jgi:hypothetical protein
MAFAFYTELLKEISFISSKSARMRMKMKKKQVINHRFRAVSHSAFVTLAGF